MVVIEKFWDWFSQNDLAQWDMLEAVVAGTAFGFWVMVYRAMDQIPFFAKFRFSKDKPLPLFRPDAPNAWIPLVLYISLIRVYHWYYPKPSYGLETPTEFRIMIEVLEGIIYYDFIFFWIHLFMHKNPKLNWFFQHDIHHSQKILCANEVQHHSFIDGSLQVIVNIIVQNISLYAWFLNSNYRKHFISRLLHNIVITYMLTETHAGYDGFWCMHRLFPTFIGGAKLHELHHKYGNRYYQPFFTYLDQIMEFVLCNHLHANMQRNDYGNYSNSDDYNDANKRQ